MKSKNKKAQFQTIINIFLFLMTIAVLIILTPSNSFIGISQNSQNNNCAGYVNPPDRFH